MPKHYSDILMQAAKISKEREKFYGEATKNMQETCDILEKAFNLKLSPLQLCYVMVAIKLGRQKYKFKKDNLIDAVNYLAMGIACEENNRKQHAK